MNNENNYRAYLIRLQRSNEQSHWRVTLQNAQTNEVIQFATEGQFISFLLDTLQCAPLIIPNIAGDQTHVL